MPKWGLTPEQRAAEPWGIPESELQPSKTITDPVHKDIYLTKLECRFVDSPPMQRLRRVRQLGTTHLVYPAATHTRFSHSLGALRVAQNLLDVVIEHHQGKDPKPDLFSEWEHSPSEYNHRVAEAIVLTRLGALLHDLCHVPFGHSVEDDLGLLEPHDENIERFDKLWQQFDVSLREIISEELKEALRYPLILSKLKGHTPSESSQRYPFVADIVGNTICADLIDYLQRDHYFTGLPAKVGDRFIQGFYVTPSNHPQRAQQMVIQISRGGRERRDVISELFKYLRYRYELSERALVHHAKLAADAMLGKLFELWRDSLWTQRAQEKLSLKGRDLGLDIGDLRRSIIIKHKKKDLPEQIDIEVQEYLEKIFMSHGDDGLLEYILATNAGEDQPNPRQRGVASLANDLLNRKLFKPIGYCHNRAIASDIYKKYGPAKQESRQARRHLEEEIATFAGLEHHWHLLLWVPSPDMRLKAAAVLVDDEEAITPLNDRDRAKGGNRGREIYDAHENLWSLSVYVHPTIARDFDLCERILARLSQVMGGIRWQRNEPQPKLGELLAREVAARQHLTSEEERELEVVAGDLCAHQGTNTFEGLVEQLESTVPNQKELPIENDSQSSGEK